MTDVREATDDLLAVDDRTDGWTFDGKAKGYGFAIHNYESFFGAKDPE